LNILIPLFSPPTGSWGSLTRVIALGHEARARGHDVAFCASGYLADRLKKLEYKVYPIPETTMFGLPKPLSDLFAARSQDMAPPIPPGRSFGSIWLVLMMTGMAGYGYLRRLVKAELDAVDAFRPDILFTEIDPGALLVSRIRGIPISCTFAGVFTVGTGDFAWRKLKASGNRVLADYGKAPAEPQELILDSRTLKIIPSIPELEKDLPDTPDYVFTGSLFRSFRAASEQTFRPEPGKRYAFVYMGSGSVQLSKAVRVLAKMGGNTVGAQRALPLQHNNPQNIQFCVGSQTVAGERRTGNVAIRHFWDAETLLPHCEWTFCHGGHNTIIQSLAHGIPLIVFPGAIFERRFNGEMVEKAGAGRVGELPDFKERWIAQAMSGQEECAANAKRLGKKIRSLGGARRAVKALEGWVKK
jgi:hypothetical protein